MSLESAPSRRPIAAATAKSLTARHHRPTPRRTAQAAAALCMGIAATAAWAAGDTSDPGPTDQVIVTGTRVETTVLKSSSPIQVVDGQSLRDTGASDLRTALSAVAPSYISVNTNGSALGKNTRGSSLRGLAGNHVLLLVNGRRRHGSALINNSGGATLGSSAADLAHIPVSAVERVEVLTDGASALYGSDAIAGVINVILRSDAEGGSANVSYGEYNHSVSKVNGVGNAGRTSTLDLNQGLALGEDGGFLNLSASFLDSGSSHVVGPWKQPTRPIWQIYADPSDPREAAANRAVHSSVEVIPEQKLGNASFNLELPFTPQLKGYAFGTYSRRNSGAKGSFRTETNGTAHVATTPGGYGPRLRTREEDMQLNAGLSDEGFYGWSWDVGGSHGRNRAVISVLNTTNASFGPLVPLQDMKAGQLHFSETVLNASARRRIDTGVFDEPLQLSTGIEHRRNAQSLGQGDYLSYAAGGYVFPADYPAVNLRGTLAGAGSAFLTGFAPQFEYTRTRHNEAIFLDLSQKVLPTWQLGAAARYEHYSDFGVALSGKVSSRYEVNPQLAVRGTVSSGFRAPSLQEQYYQSATVQPLNDPITNTSYISYNYDTLSPTAPAAVALGASELRPEKSNNYSVGFVFTPTRNLSGSIDFYQIDIRDRIYLTGAFNGFNNPTVAGILTGAGLTHQQSVRYFTNIGETQTRGVELKLDYHSNHGEWGRAHWALAYGHNRQKVRRLNTPAALAGTGLNLLGRDRFALLEQALPQHIARASVNWRYGNFHFDLAENFYSKTRVVNNVLNPDQDSVTGNTFTTDAAITWNFSKDLRLALGARNLFNKRAPNQPDSLASTQNYENPNPNQASPYGIGGAFYYFRLGYAW